MTRADVHYRHDDELRRREREHAESIALVLHDTEKQK